MRSFEDVVSQYTQKIPEGMNQILNFTSLTVVVERVRLDVVLVFIDQIIIIITSNRLI